MSAAADWRGYRGRAWQFSRRIAAHKGTLALVDQAVVSATNFASSILIARCCGKAQLGLYLLIWSTVFIINAVQSAVITTPYFVMIPTMDSKRQDGYRGSALLHQLFLSCAATLVLLAVSIGMHSEEHSDLRSLLEAVSPLLIVLLFREFSRGMWFAHLEMKVTVLADCGASLLQMVLLGVIAATGYLSAATAYAAITTAAAIPSVTWLVMYRRRLVPSAIGAWRDFQINWRLAKWVACSGVLWAAAIYSYPWLLVWARDASAAGIWAACYGLAALSNPVLLGFGNYLGPQISHINGEKGVSAMRRYVYNSSVRFVVLLLPLAILVWYGGDFFIKHLYGPGFMGHEAVIRILALNVLLLGAIFPISRGFFVLQRADIDTCVNILAMVTLFILGLPMVRFYGVMGAALGLTATAALTGVIRVAVFVRLAHRFAGSPAVYPRTSTENVA